MEEQREQSIATLLASLEGGGPEKLLTKEDKDKISEWSREYEPVKFPSGKTGESIWGEGYHWKRTKREALGGLQERDEPQYKQYWKTATEEAVAAGERERPVRQTIEQDDTLLSGLEGARPSRRRRGQRIFSTLLGGQPPLLG